MAGGKDSKEGRQTVFFTAVDPTNEPRKDESYDVNGPREVLYRTKWKFYQNAVCWITLKNTQDRISILANKVQRYGLRQLCASRLS